MVLINLGYTAPINRPGESPVLTIDQVWAGLQRKVRYAQEFVPLIVGCEVLSEEKDPAAEEVDVITRRVTFAEKAGPMSGRIVTEVCKLYAPCRVDFVQEDGSKITNCVTRGESGEPGDLYLTYIFEWRHPNVAEGSEEAQWLEGEHRKTAGTAVEGSIATIREMFSK
ncbi:DUF1857-domain-containing protein [Canariomyces notabilis]|uniref:DUF1857-domain-containing protein n=1 Tax=Canariomyces notabilis TaxID=2074819 RepID=A0AAN6TEW2_9PEZI|nr:DUF1857-domain-containing protein [Canariomyces arenarius]